MMKDIRLPKGCDLIHLPNVVDDRGMLTFVEGNKHIPFEIKRIFWTYRVKEGQTRGNHAHRTCSMVLFPVGGSYKIELDDGTFRCTLHMEDPHVGLLVPPGVWCRRSSLGSLYAIFVVRLRQLWACTMFARCRQTTLLTA
ncbi:MAG: FdtA/QdtA family cupin domain-containing protein, partial [Bacteroidaceae bacterium]|nr:FdtA/QdtA family cupin domain-containing protein [Bacteroidaceae bacterium]